LFKIDTNIVEVARGLKALLNKKNLMPAIFLLRGVMELMFFNIFITFKSFRNIKNNNLDAFIDIILKGSLATDVEGFKSNSLKSESVIYNKIIKKYKGKRLHINDCIRFLKKDTVRKIIGTKETNSSKSYKTLEKKIRPNKKSKIDEYIKIRTEVAETSPSTLRIVQQEDPDMKQGIGAVYKST